MGIALPVRRARYAVLFVLLLAATALGASEEAPTDDGLWYYRIGGGSPYRPLSSPLQQPLAGANAWDSAGSCSFPLRGSLRHYMNDTDNNIYGLGRGIIRSSSNMILASSMGVVQRSNPGLYDLLMKGIADARERYDIALGECRSQQRDGGGLLADWLSLSKGHSWAQALRRGEQALAAEGAIEQRGGAAGLPWVAGRRAGGTGQEALRPVRDIVRAGFRRWSGASVAPGDVRRVWRNAEQAAAWVVAVVGDKELRTCPQCTRVRTHAGAGLRPRQQREFTRLKELFERGLARGWDGIGAAQLSAPGMGIVVTARLLQALGKESPAQRDILLHRLAGEMALARVLEKALLARQLLEMGRQEPNVAVNGIAQREIDAAQRRLRHEMEEILFEQRVRGAVFTRTAQLLLERAEQRAGEGGRPLGAAPTEDVLRLEDAGAPAAR